MARRAPGRNKWLGLLVWFGAACQLSPESGPYIDASKARMEAREGRTYVQGKPVSGVLFETNAQGDTVFRIPFSEGKENGVARFFYPNRRLREERFFVEGRKEGVHRGWYETGQPRFEYHFQNDVFEGSYKEWFPNGKLFRLMHYENGQESGVQQGWYASGRIKMNYVIKDDRRYGLLGTKNCKNVSDSLFRK